MTLKVWVDWNNNGNFTDGIDDISADVMEASWKLGMRNAYQMMADEMTLDLMLKNTDGKYLPENTGGTLSGLLLPNRKVKVAFDTGGTTAMWFGFLSWPEVEWSPSGTSTAKVTASLNGVGPKRQMEELEIPLGIYNEVTGDEIISDVIELSSLPATISDSWVIGVAGLSELGSTTILADETDYATIETGVTVFDTYGDTTPPSAWDVITDVTEGERGKFFFDRDGKAVWWNRTHLISDTDNAGTVSSAGTYKPIALDYTYGTQLANMIRVESRPRNVGTGETLWELDTPVQVPVGGTVELEARLRKSTGQFAGSSNLTASPEFSAGTATVTVTPQGGKAKIQLVNESTTAAAVLSGLTLSGAPVVQQNNLSVTAMDEDSIAIYGKQSMNIDLGSVSDYATAKSIGDFELFRRKDARGEINWVKFRAAADGTANAHLLAWTIGTRLRVDIDELHHDSDYFVVGEEHRWQPGDSGGVHEVKYNLEPAQPGGAWLIGVAGFSELGSTTALAA